MGVPSPLTFHLTPPSNTSNLSFNHSPIFFHAARNSLLKSGPIKKESSPDIRRKSDTITTRENNKQVTVVKGQFERWKITGVISLSSSHISVIPKEVWNCGSFVRFLDLNSNSIEDVPEAIGGLISLQKLFLNSNRIDDESVSWKGLSLLKSLTLLNLNQNLLTSLPSDLGCLTTLKELHVAHNMLTTLPDEVGLLVHLEVLEANDNRLTTITSCIGSCSALVEVDFSENLLIELPETLSNLTNLKALHLHNNGLKSLPSLLLKCCTQLSTLDLHGTQITMDMLREFEGWESFDERRVLKHSKQLAFRVRGATDSYFDEGADKS
ncbi:plant intracellular Ras-group-related LRR protein 8-like isoform X2 [Bidens hawaiensis]|uniref:plant intracellular Ras-group-related LRR protein 8-like isoform X2 n=1 Tax=Bidens hawaiensis TaxID=980011 RepID=UPI00404912EC